MSPLSLTSETICGRIGSENLEYAYVYFFWQMLSDTLTEEKGNIQITKLVIRDMHLSAEKKVSQIWIS